MMDGRTREARFLAQTRQELTAHLGGKPSATQSVLIERAAMLRLHLAQLDEKALRAGNLTDHDHRHYLAWSNSLDRALRHLGLTGAEAKPITLADILATSPGGAE